MKKLILTIIVVGLSYATSQQPAQAEVDRSDKDFKVALVAVAIAVRCDEAFDDPEIVTAAREMMIYALRNQGLEDPYSESDKIIATLDGTVLTPEQQAVFTKETCAQTKMRLLSVMR